MTKNIVSNTFVVFVAVVALLCLIFGSSVDALAADGFKGWETGSVYNSKYDPKERDSLKGSVVELRTVTPMPGMAPGTAFVLQESEDDKILVHLCPEAFASANDIGIRRGDKVKVKGSWVEIDGADVFIASKVKMGDHFEFKVRLTSDGTPFWTMSPEQLKEESKKE
jgi:hypothetical protein